MRNKTLGSNGSNKSESFMTVILKVNPIQIGLSNGLSKVQGLEDAYKKTYVGVREIKFGQRG